jgi:hypothetical protein
LKSHPQNVSADVEFPPLVSKVNARPVSHHPLDKAGAP